MRTSVKCYVWGLAETGALGLERDLKRHKLPVMKLQKFPKRQPFAEHHQIIDASAGYGFTVFAVEPSKDYGNYTLYGTGLNTDSQCGYHKLRGKTYNPLALLIYPAPIELPRDTSDEIHTVTQVACGRAHTIAVTSSGKIFTLGNNSYGQCGREIIEDEQYMGSEVVNRIDSRIFNNEALKGVTCGQDHSMFLTESGKLYSCGWGADGQTGLGHYNNQSQISLIEGDIKGENITKVSSVGDCVLALNDKGEVFGWGNSEYNQILLNSDEQQVSLPVHMKYLNKFGKVIDVAAGGSFSMILNENGDVFVWGYGLLGFGPAVDHCKMPKLIPPTLFGRNAFNPNLRVTSINCGLYHMAAINSDNDLFMWGRNKSACLGFGHEKDQYFPFKANVAAKVEKILCGVDHSIALCKTFI
jgi:RCC1-like G exchanging factor-like protein